MDALTRDETKRVPRPKWMTDMRAALVGSGVLADAQRAIREAVLAAQPHEANERPPMTSPDDTNPAAAIIAHVHAPHTHSPEDARMRALEALRLGFAEAQAAEASDFSQCGDGEFGNAAARKMVLDRVLEMGTMTQPAEPQAIPGQPIPEEQEPDDPEK